MHPFFFHFQVRVEDTDCLVLLIHHVKENGFPVYVTTQTGTYKIQDMQQALSVEEKIYILIIHAFTGCDTVSGIHGFGKTTLLQRLCSAPQHVKGHMRTFLSATSSKEEIAHSGKILFQYIYGGLGTSLGDLRYTIFTKKAATGVIAPESLPPTDGSAVQHSLRSYIQTQDWVVLESMSREATQYGFEKGSKGYMPIATLEEWAPPAIRDLIKCNCKGDCDNKRCSCYKNCVQCIAACGTCKGMLCKNSSG